jgi:hypothetical protein
MGAPRCVCVRNPCKSHHRIERKIDVGQQGLEQVIEFFLGAKCSQRRFIAHLDEIVHGKIRERVGIFFSPIYVNRLFAFTTADSAIHAS